MSDNTKRPDTKTGYLCSPSETLAIAKEVYADIDAGLYEEIGENLRRRITRGELEELDDLTLIDFWQKRSDPDSLQVLIDRYVPLRSKLVRAALSGRVISTSHRADVEQEAILAFISACNNFDPAHNASLATYATNKIRPQLLQYNLTFRSAFRIGKGSDERKAYYAAQKIRMRNSGHGVDGLRPADVAEIERMTGASKKAVNRAVMAATSQTTSQMIETEEALQSKDHATIYEEQDAQDKAMALLGTYRQELDEREQAILEAYYLDEDGDSRQELADRFGITPERVGQLHRSVLKKLRGQFESEGIDCEAVF